MLALLADIRSSHNVGSMFRTADAVGVGKLYLCGLTPEPRDRYGRPNEKLLKVALGAEKTVEWEYAKSTTRLLDKLKKEGFEIWALEQSKRAESIMEVRLPNIRKSDFQRNFQRNPWDFMVLVVGNEIKGLSRAVLKRADRIIQIPMFGKKESLNVSVAFGIAVFQLRARIKKQ